MPFVLLEFITLIIFIMLLSFYFRKIKENKISIILDLKMIIFSILLIIYDIVGPILYYSNNSVNDAETITFHGNNTLYTLGILIPKLIYLFWIIKTNKRNLCLRSFIYPLIILNIYILVIHQFIGVPWLIIFSLPILCLILFITFLIGFFKDIAYLNNYKEKNTEKS